MAVNGAWKMAQVEVDKLPPYLDEDDLTAERLVERNKGMITRTDAETILKRLTEEGRLVEEKRRNPRGGSHVLVYVEAK